MRLDKLLSNFGFGSRKEVKELIKDGLVEVNGKTVKSPSISVNPEKDQITVDGIPLEYRKNFYFMFNKPSGYITAKEDVTHPTVMDFFIREPVYEKLFPVGRLDLDTEGLLIITDDGTFAHRLSHPKWNVEKEYYVEVEGDVSNIDFSKFEKEGLFLKREKYQTKPFKVEVLETSDDVSKLKITLKEGKYHIVKNIFNELGHPVLYLKRERIGSLKLDENLKPGEYRHLTEEEINSLKELVNLT